MKQWNKLEEMQKKDNWRTNVENVSRLAIAVEVALVHCNIVNNDYQQDSKVKTFRNFTKKYTYLKTYNSKFSYIEVWFTD